MVFSSLNFVLIFMPVFFACYYIVPDKWKNAVLLIGSHSVMPSIMPKRMDFKTSSIYIINLRR